MFGRVDKSGVTRAFPGVKWGRKWRNIEKIREMWKHWGHFLSCPPKVVSLAIPLVDVHIVLYPWEKYVHLSKADKATHCVHNEMRYDVKSKLEMTRWEEVQRMLLHPRGRWGGGEGALGDIIMCRSHDPLFSGQLALPSLLISHQCAAHVPPIFKF